MDHCNNYSYKVVLHRWDESIHLYSCRQTTERISKLSHTKYFFAWSINFRSLQACTLPNTPRNGFCLYLRCPQKAIENQGNSSRWCILVYYFSTRNQDCYFTLNDLEAKQNYKQNVEIVLKKPGMTYIAKGNEIIVSTPRFSKRGLILIRIVIMDPNDRKEIKRITKVQRLVTTETFDIE